jgi:DNA polymerase-3 subunit delta'
MSIGEDFIGNQKVVGHLNKILAKGLVAHAYIFDGPEHIGKTRLALDFASSLLENSYLDIMKNPDLIFVGLDENKGEVVAENIRNLQKSLSLYPYSSKRKVAIIDKAHLMNKTAANSLLKILEEPNETSVLILLSSDLDRILETIKSRCQVMSLRVVEKKIIKDSLQSKEKNIEKILDISLGRPGIAINMLKDTESFEKAMGYKDMHINISSGNNFRRMEESEKVCSLNKCEIDRMLDIFTISLREELLSDINRKSQIDKIEKTKNKIELINKTKSDINENNANMRLAIENLYLNL